MFVIFILGKDKVNINETTPSKAGPTPHQYLVSIDSLLLENSEVITSQLQQTPITNPEDNLVLSPINNVIVESSPSPPPVVVKEPKIKDSKI